MTAQDQLAQRFEEHRGHLRGVAYRMLGSLSEAEDAVQEAWLRLSRAEAEAIDNLGGWLTTVVSRICLDQLRSRAARREDPLASAPAAVRADAPTIDPQAVDPQQEAELADSVGLALLVVLDTLDPAERLAFVLHDLFGVPFDEVAVIVDRSVPASRQLASRARRRVRGAPTVQAADQRRQREVVEAFLAAARNGEFEALLALLDPDVVAHADAAAVRLGGPPEIRGAVAVAGMFLGRAQAARPVLIDGALGVVVAPHGHALLVLGLRFAGGRIVEIDAIAEPAQLRELALAIPA
jgi:RNA polymerase sigma-70 factor, ECF subfamily